MNRKLLNGLLVLAVAAGGVGTFTSCKDENFKDDLLLEQQSLSAKLDAIRAVSDAQFKEALEKWLNGWTADASHYGSYQDLLSTAEAMEDLYNLIKAGNITSDLEPFAEGLYAWLNENYLDEKFQNLQDQIDDLKDALEALTFDQASRPSSIAVNQVFNPVFGTINLPVGINSTVLATYIYSGTDAEYKFPARAFEHTTEFSPIQPDSQLANIINELSSGISVELKNNSFTDPDGTFGNMGGAVVNFNPSNIDINAKDENGNNIYTVELIRSNGEAPFSTVDGSLAIEDFNDDLMFGTSRAGAADLYALQVNATEDNLEAIKFDVDKSGIKDAVNQLWKDKSLSNVAHLGETLYNSVNEKLPAYSVKVSWNEEVANENGEVSSVPNSIYSEFNLAAFAVHPLSYGADLGAVIPSDKKLPIVHNPLTYYLDQLQNKIHIDFSKIEGVDDIDLITTFTGNGTIKAEVVGKDGKGTGNYIYLTYTADGVKKAQPGDQDLNYFIKNLLGTMQDDINDSVITAINDAIDGINKQLADLEAQLGDFRDYIDRLENSKKLTYVQKLVDLYNELAEKANDFLADPDHYLQVMMAYSVGSGAHHMSNDIYMPVTVTGAGDAFEIITSSYNGDVLVPSYKKYVAITGVVNPDMTISSDNLAALNTAAGLNQVYDGTLQKCVMKVTDQLKNKTLRLTYVSVDYRGMCSMENYYLIIK